MLNEKQQRLKQILENNINNEKVGTAIAITGSWGVGKTYFWNTFRENNTLKKKYVYVSLFGLESLSDLKTHIYSNIENNHSLIEIPRWIRGLPSILKDTRVSQFGVNASAKVFDNLMFHQVKDAIICFDDFERMSNKLDIKDVMGLANQLKLEKNCQIVLILDEDKTEDENKKKYAEYKEKLIDETIKITSVEPLIRANAKDIDEPLVDLMVEFAEKLEIHNFRFFQKVIKLYKQFQEQLPEQVAYSTKKIILVRILQGYLINDFPKLEYTWGDSEYFIEKHREDWSEVRKNTYENLLSVSYAFVENDLWLVEFKNWFDQKETVDIIKLNELANSELISERNSHIKEELNHLMNQWRNLEVNQNYCDCLFERSFESISFNNLENLDFHCFLLKKLGRNDLSKKLKNEVINWLNLSLQNDSQKTYDDAFHFGYVKDNLFHWYINRWKEKNPLAGLPSLFDTLKELILFGANNNKFNQILQNSTLNDWENFIFSQSSVDHELKEIHKGKIMTKILQQNIDTSLTPLIKQNIELTLLAKIQASTDRSLQKNIEFVIENFKKEGLL